MKFKFLALVTALIAIFVTNIHATPPGSGWTQTYDQEFTTMPTFCDTYGKATPGLIPGDPWQDRSYGNEQEYFCFPGIDSYNPFSITSSDSEGLPCLNITAEPTPAGMNTGGQPYVSGMFTTCSGATGYGGLQSSTPFGQQYGYFEMRAKLPTGQGQGYWPAFYLMPYDAPNYSTTVSGNTGTPNLNTTEYDIFEVLGTNSTPTISGPTAIFQSSHWNDYAGNISYQYNGPNTSTGFHTFGFEWDATNIRWYVDGVLTQTLPNQYDGPMYMLVALQIGDSWPGNATASTVFPGQFQIEYLRAYAGGNVNGTTGTTAQTISNFPSTLSLSTTVSPYTLTGSLSSALPLTYLVSSGPATVSGNTLTLTGAGTVVLTASQAGNSTYAPFSATETITVTSPSLITQTISNFPATLSLSTTASPYILNTPLSSGLGVTYTVTSGPATVSGSKLTLTGAGTVVLKATQAGNSTYAAFSATETITVTSPSLTTQTISNFPSTLNLSTSASPYTLNTPMSSGLGVTYSVTSGPATVSGGTLTLTGAGMVILVASQAGNSTYAPFSATETITVSSPTLITQTISNFPATLSLATTASPYILNTPMSSGLPVVYTVSSGPASVSGGTLTLTGTGTVVLKATQAGNATYAAFSATETITVSSPTLTTQTIANFLSNLSLSTSASPYALTATTSAGLTVTYSVTSGPATVSGNTLTLTGTGTVLLKAIQAGNSTYAPYSATETITVSTSSLTAQTISGFPPTLSLTASTTPYTLPDLTTVGYPITYTVISGPATLAYDNLTFSGGGTVVVQATQAGDSTYAPLSATETITVTQVVQTVSGFPPTLTLTSGLSMYTLPQSTSIGFPVVYTVISGPATLSYDNLTFTGTSPVVVQATQAGNGTFAPFSATETISFTGDLTAQTVTGFPATVSLLTTASPYTLPDVTSAGLNLTYSVTSGPATISGNTMTISGAGTIVVQATQAGTSIYAPFSGTETFTVTQATQSVSNFPATQSVARSITPFTLPATTSAGLTITYSVVSGPATVSGNALTFTGTGTVVIKATQAGNSTYASVTTTETITVTAATATMTFAQWEAQSGFFTAAQMANPSISGATATPQGDGVSNLLKYLYNINPAVTMTPTEFAAMALYGVDTTTTPGTTYLTASYRQYAMATGITIKIQTSPDMQTWTTVTPDLSQQVGTDPTTGDPIMLVEVNSHGTSPEFIRLTVTMP